MGISYDRWLSKGRKAEDGIVPERYLAMQELAQAGYPKWTEQNVIDSDATDLFG